MIMKLSLTWVNDSFPFLIYDNSITPHEIPISGQESTMETQTHLKKKLQQLGNRIAETKKRLPAHSVKPPIMMELLALEDEYEALLIEITALSRDQENTVFTAISNEEKQ